MVHKTILQYIAQLSLDVNHTFDCDNKRIQLQFTFQHVEGGVGINLSSRQKSNEKKTRI